MTIRDMLLGAVLASAPALAAGQAAGHQSAPASEGSANIAGCAQAQVVVTHTIDAAASRLETARQTNSPAAMRAAVDDVGGVLGEVRAQLMPCAQMEATVPAGTAGHAMPNMPQAPAAQAPATPRPSPGTLPQTAAPARPAAPAVNPHPGHVMPPSPAARSTAAGARVATGAAASAATPVTSVEDLRCANGVNAKTAPRVLHQGRTYYFCSDQERAAFTKDPAKYVTAPAGHVAPSHGQ